MVRRYDATEGPSPSIRYTEIVPRMRPSVLDLCSLVRVGLTVEALVVQRPLTLSCVLVYSVKLDGGQPPDS